MKRTHISELSEKIGHKALVKGFVQTIRNQGKIAFLIIRDVTGTVQAVSVSKENPENFKLIEELSLESVVEISGLVKEEKQAPEGYEIAVEEIKILSKAEPELPIPILTEKGGDETDMSIRFDWRWLDLRKPEKIKLFKIWTELETGMRNHFEKENYIQIYTPAIMSTPSESGAEVFEVKYFDRKAYLAQSPQFYKQAAMSAGFEKVFMTGPVFRAEPSFTTRHMTEFTGWDFEISYIESHYDVMEELENIMIEGFKQVKKTLLPDLKVPEKPFPKITMKEAKEKLSKLGVKSERPYDVSPEEERKLGEIFQEEGHDFYFLTDYPIEARPFYHMRYEDHPEITMSYDLMYKGLEIVTGAQREHRVAYLEKQALEKGLTLESIEDYLNFFRYGCPPHGGGGLGPGRIIMQMLDYTSVKETAFLPRDVKRIRP